MLQIFVIMLLCKVCKVYFTARRFVDEDRTEDCLECVCVESSKVNQYGNEAPGAPSLQAELAKLREENTVLKCTAKGLSRFLSLLIFYVIAYFKQVLNVI